MTTNPKSKCCGTSRLDEVSDNELNGVNATIKHLHQSLIKANEELVAYRNFTLDIEEFTNVCICQCEEKMSDTDLQIYLSVLKSKLSAIAAQEKMK